MQKYKKGSDIASEPFIVVSDSENFAGIGQNENILAGAKFHFITMDIQKGHVLSVMVDHLLGVELIARTRVEESVLAISVDTSLDGHFVEPCALTTLAWFWD